MCFRISKRRAISQLNIKMRIVKPTRNYNFAFDVDLEYIKLQYFWIKYKLENYGFSFYICHLITKNYNYNFYHVSTFIFIFFI